MTDIKDRLRDAAGSAGETVRESDLPPAPRLRRRRRFPSPRLLVPLTAVATALVVVVAVVLATPELRTDVTTGGIPDFYAYTTRPVNDERGGELFVRSTRTGEVLTKLELNPRWRNTVAAAPDNRTFYVSSSKPAGCHTRIRRLVVDEAGKRVSFDDVPVSVPPHTYAINVVAGTHHLAFALGLCRSQDPGQAEDPVLSLTDLRTGATRSWLGYRENYAIFTLMQQGQFSMTADGSRPNAT